MGEGKRSHDNGKERPRKKGKYVSPNNAASNQAIPLGAVGILVTCDGGRERKAALQLIPIIEQCYDELAGTNAEKDEKGASSAADIRSLIEAEVQDSKNKDKFRFKYCDTAVKGCSFIRFPSEEGGPPPQAVALKLLRQVEASKQLPSPLISRLLPVTHTCHANMDAVEKMAKEIVPSHFPSGEGVEGCSFSIEYEHRSCDKFNRTQVINAFANLVTQPLYKVDLSNPKRTIIVQISRNVCAASVVEDYKALAKYNLRKLAEVQEEEAKGKGDKAAAPDAKPPLDEVASKGDDVVAPEVKPPSDEVASKGDDVVAPEAKPPLDEVPASDRKEASGKDGGEDEDQDAVPASTEDALDKSTEAGTNVAKEAADVAKDAPDEKQE